MGEILEWLLKGVAQLLIETVIQGTGWLILRPFRAPEKINPEGCLVTLIGLLFWCLAAMLLVVALSV